ncbi:MAG: hypothetical protein WCW77_02815 [Patescibacteria group bacterium]|jgi:hypothetical protein
MKFNLSISKSALPALVFVFFLFSPIQSFWLGAEKASADTYASNAMTGLNTTADNAFGTGYSSSQSSFNIYTAAGKYVGVALTFLGIIFLGLMMYAGAAWMMARGNAEESKKAMSMLNDAMIGLIIVLGAYALTKFIGNILIAK